MPSSSVLSAEAITRQATAAMTARDGSRSASRCAPIQRGSPRRTPITISATNASTNTRFSAAPPMLVAVATATTKARMLHAVTSSTAAQVMAVLPSAVCDRPRSCRMRASTGKAVMLIEMPMNRAKDTNEVPGAASLLNRKYASSTPSRYGKTMLAWLTATAVCALPRMCLTFTSMPTVNMNKHTPIWLRIPSTPMESFGNTNAKASGASRPNSDGPSRMPAAISPTTAGCPIHTNSRLTSRDTAMIASNCRNR